MTGMEMLQTEHLKYCIQWENMLAFLFCVRSMTEYSVSSKVEAAINKQLANEEEGKA